MTLDILYEDNHLIAAIKPPGALSQADATGAPDMLTLLKAYIREKYAKPGDVYLGLVHRLDRPVGGAMIFARTSKAAARLSAQVRGRELGKTYLAVAETRGKPPPSGVLSDWLVKDAAVNTVRVCSPDAPGAKLAELVCTPVTEARGLALLRLELLTGRSHQIRVQLASRGCPLWADARYGRPRSGADIALWAESLTFTHPTLKTDLRITCPPPCTAPWSAFAGREGESSAGGLRPPYPPPGK